MPSTDNITEIPLTNGPVAPDLPATAPQTPQAAPSLLDKFCTAIRDYEGAPGDLNYRNNNPGNCRCSSVGYLPKYGNVKCVNNFAVFETYELGWEYLQALVKQRATEHTQWSILDFFENYSPSADGNNPTLYAMFVAKRLGVQITYTLSELNLV